MNSGAHIFRRKQREMVPGNIKHLHLPTNHNLPSIDRAAWIRPIRQPGILFTRQRTHIVAFFTPQQDHLWRQSPKRWSKGPYHGGIEYDLAANRQVARNLNVARLLAEGLSVGEGVCYFDG